MKLFLFLLVTFLTLSMTVRGQDADWGDDAADADAYIMVIKVKYTLKRLHTKAVTLTELLMIVAMMW